MITENTINRFKTKNSVDKSYIFDNTFKFTSDNPFVKVSVFEKMSVKHRGK